MEIKYKNKQIEKICTDQQQAKKKHGLEIAVKLFQRINEIKASNSLEDMERNNIGGCHKLQGKRTGQYAFILKQPFRLIVEKVDNETIIAKIIEIVDYH